MQKFQAGNHEWHAQDYQLNSILQATKSKIVVDFILFLGQVPWGLCSTDLSHLVILEPAVFGMDKQFFLGVQALSLIKRDEAKTDVLDKLGDMFKFLLDSKT